MITVGSRMRTLYGDAGIVRYVGETHFKKGEWVGLELDRPKGKNDGEVRGLRYFSCRPLHGLFTKAENLVPDESPPDEPLGVEPLGVEPLGVEPLGVRRSASRSLDSSPLRAHGDSRQYEAVAAMSCGRCVMPHRVTCVCACVCVSYIRTRAGCACHDLQQREASLRPWPRCPVAVASWLIE